MPPKKRTDSKASKAPSVSCCVCCQPVNASKDEVLFCTGTCQEWIHRYCASVSVKAYRSIKDTGSPFLCFCCQQIRSQIRSQDEVVKLNNEVRQLKEEVLQLQTVLSTLQSQASPSRQAADPVRNVTSVRSYAAAATPGGESPSNSKLSTSSNVQTSSTRLVSSSDKKFNIVIYGIDECAKGTSRSERLESDFSKVVSVVSGIDSNVHSQAIKDCFRLGKYDPQHKRPRPILVKFIRTLDVSSILSKRSVLSPPINIKPDMSPEERLRDSVLLKERWSLIQSGISRSDIKIRKSHLYVKNKPYGQYQNSVFVHSVPPASSLAGISHDQASIVPLSDSHSVCQSQSTSTYLTPSPVSSNLSNSTIQPASPIQGISHDQTSIVPLSDSHSVCQSQSTSTYLTPSPVSSNLSNSTIQPASPIQDCVQSSMSTLSTDKNAVSQSPD